MANTEQAAPAQAGNQYVTEEARRAGENARVQREREKQKLRMQRENILSQRTSNPGRREALAAALKEIEAQLAQYE